MQKTIRIHTPSRIQRDSSKYYSNSMYCEMENIYVMEEKGTNERTKRAKKKRKQNARANT